MLPLHLARRLATAAEMRAMDDQAIHGLGLPGRLLMENAAQAVARRVETLLAPGASGALGDLGAIAVCCGGGTSIADSFVTANQ